MRNKFKYRIGKLDSDYVFYIDDDVYFKIDLISNLISEMKGSIKMVVSNGILMAAPSGLKLDFHHYDTLESYLNRWAESNKIKNHFHHYDTLAFITLEGISHKQTGNTCLHINCRRCEIKRKRLKIDLDNKHLFNMDSQEGSIEIKSGFGSCSIIETNIWNKINFTNNKEEICEWSSLCNNIRDNKGKVVLSCKNKTIVVDKKANL